MFALDKSAHNESMRARLVRRRHSACSAVVRQAPSTLRRGFRPGEGLRIGKGGQSRRARPRSNVIDDKFTEKLLGTSSVLR